MAKPRGPIDHGTLNGARTEQHRRLPICALCRPLLRAYNRETAAARRAALAERRAAQGLPTYLTEDEWQAHVAAREAAAR
jgi:hypothetical protein